MIELLLPVGLSVGYLMAGIGVVCGVITINGNSLRNPDPIAFFISVCLWPLILILFFLVWAIKGSIYVGRHISVSYKWATQHLKEKSADIERVDPENFQLCEMPIATPPTSHPIEEETVSAPAVPANGSPTTTRTVDSPKKERKMKVLTKDITQRFKFMDL